MTAAHDKESVLNLTSWIFKIIHKYLITRSVVKWWFHTLLCLSIVIFLLVANTIICGVTFPRFCLFVFCVNVISKNMNIFLASLLTNNVKSLCFLFGVYTVLHPSTSYLNTSYVLNVQMLSFMYLKQRIVFIIFFLSSSTSFKNVL